MIALENKTLRVWFKKSNIDKKKTKLIRILIILEVDFLFGN